MSKQVLLPVADGSEDIESVTLIDVLRRAGATVTVASVCDSMVTMANGTKLVSDCLIKECVGKQFDLIVLPGGMPGAEHLRDSLDLKHLLTEQVARGGLYGAICASPAVVLQSHDLIDSKKVTCYPGFEEGLIFEKDSVVVDGNCVTSAGPGTAVPFALELVSQLFGKEKSLVISDQILWQF